MASILVLGGIAARMDGVDRLRHAIEVEEGRVRALVPADREAAIVAAIGAIDRLPEVGDEVAPRDVITGVRLANSGGDMALRLLLVSNHEKRRWAAPSPDQLQVWADHFLAECGRLAEARLVLWHVESGFVRLAGHGGDVLDAWVATRRPPATWIERADVDWWARWLRERHGDALRVVRTGVGDRGDGGYDRLAAAHLETMAYQLGFPDDAVIDGYSVATYRRVLERLLSWALRARDRAEPSVRSERDLVAAVAAALGLAESVAARTLSAFTVDRENAAYHTAVPGVGSAPLVRVAPDLVVWSTHGLIAEPLIFLTRELRRRAADDYHNVTHLREGVFRQDLYKLFSDKRFATAPGRIALRRERGDLQTDIDAAVFDRKTGTLALFELKSLDPFARSPAELARQRDTVMYANRQVSGVLTWLQRHGPDDILDRVDHATAKRFRVQKVLPFVLARYLVSFEDGPEPDRRAAWGSWPQVLRLLGGQAAGARDANPLAALFTRLRSEMDRADVMRNTTARVIALDDVRIVVHPSYAAYRASAEGLATVE